MSLEKDLKIKTNSIFSDSLLDRLMFGWVKKMVGGRCRLLVVGSAPLAGNILTFMRASLGCVVSNVIYVILFCCNIVLSFAVTTC